MKTILKASKVINIIALLFLIFGPYGIAITGFLQVIAALFLIVFPKNLMIYIYFAIVGFFFLFWDERVFHAFFLIPIGLIIYLSYLIHFKKI